MPTLFRLLIAVLFLAAICFGGLFALTVFVDPGEKQVTVRIPQRDMALTPIVPKPVAPVTAAAVLPPSDDSSATEVDTSE